jgi:hypothetical protein
MAFKQIARGHLRLWQTSLACPVAAKTSSRAHLLGRFQVKAPRQTQRQRRAPLPAPGAGRRRRQQHGAGPLRRPANGSRSRADRALVRRRTKLAPTKAQYRRALRVACGGGGPARYSRGCQDRAIAPNANCRMVGRFPLWLPSPLGSHFFESLLVTARATGSSVPRLDRIGEPSSGSCRVGLMQPRWRAGEAPAASLEAHEGLAELGHGGRHVLAG